MGAAGRAQPTVNVAPARNAVLFFLKYLRLAYLRLALEARPMLRLPFQREVSYVVVLYVVAASRRGAAARSLVAAAGELVAVCCEFAPVLYARRLFSALRRRAGARLQSAVYARRSPQRGKTMKWQKCVASGM